MVQAVFIDYMGTTVDERSPEMAEIVRRICKNSAVHDPEQVQRFILDDRRRYEADSYLDARAFFERCPVPIYIITNNGLPYMERALAQNGLKAAGVVSADTVRAYKPHRELFEEALRISGCAPDEAVHIGDSYDTDVVGARAAGIRPVLLLRGKAPRDGVESADDLTQALDLIFK